MLKNQVDFFIEMKLQESSKLENWMHVGGLLQIW